jgi:uncharacterized MAPEG superfamily protein
MKTELFYLALVATFTALMWVPYVLNRFAVWGIPDTVGYPDDPKPLAPWAERLKRAHANAVENLVVFATLVLCADLLNIIGGAVATAAMLYFWSRLVHALAYTFKVPWLRTLGFTGGFVAQMWVAFLVLTR